MCEGVDGTSKSMSWDLEFMCGDSLATLAERREIGKIYSIWQKMVENTGSSSSRLHVPPRPQTSANDGQGRAVAALFLDLSEQAGDHRNSYVYSLINCPATDFAKSTFSLLFPSANFSCLISEHLA